MIHLKAFQGSVLRFGRWSASWLLADFKETKRDRAVGDRNRGRDRDRDKERDRKETQR